MILAGVIPNLTGSLGIEHVLSPYDDSWVGFPMHYQGQGQNVFDRYIQVVYPGVECCQLKTALHKFPLYFREALYLGNIYIHEEASGMTNKHTRTVVIAALPWQPPLT